MSKHGPPQSRSHGPYKNPCSPQASLLARSRGEQLALQGPLGSASLGVAVGGNSPREVKRRDTASSWLGVSRVAGRAVHSGLSWGRGTGRDLTPAPGRGVVSEPLLSRSGAWRVSVLATPAVSCRHSIAVQR